MIKESSQNDQDSSSALGDSGGMKKEDIRVAAGNEIQGVKRKKPENEKPCNACEIQGVHLERADICRKEYRLDVERNMREHDHIFSMDMQKVMMLPYLPGIKTALFTHRILIINQTIAPVGGIECGGEKPIGYLWHEAVRGRNDEDVASVVIKFLTSRNYENLTI